MPITAANLKDVVETVISATAPLPPSTVAEVTISETTATLKLTTFSFQIFEASATHTLAQILALTVNQAAAAIRTTLNNLLVNLSQQILQWYASNG